MANSYLNRTAVSGNSKTWTFSAWVKRSALTSGSYDTFFSADLAVTNSVRITFSSDSSNDKLRVYYYTGSMQMDLVTNREFRDTSAWYHIVVQVDTTQATASNRAKIYVNGVQETSFATSTYPSQNTDTSVNYVNSPHEVGRGGGNLYFNGYLSHVVLVDGTVVAPTEFGSTDSTSGIWKFKSPSGLTFGNNGFHLKFENSGNLGLDSSGETHNYTVNGNLKQSLSTPSNTYATPNPLENLRVGNTSNAPSYSNGSNTVTGSAAANHQWNCGFGISKGKWYWELKALASNPDASIGYRKQTDTSGSMQNLFGFSFANDKKRIDGALSGNAIGSTAQNDIYGMALDLDNGEMFIHRNGTYLSSGNPATRANPFITTSDGLPSEGVFGGHVYDGSVDINFGEGRFGTTAISSAGSNGNGSLFEYDVPSGYYALNTKNINTYG